MFRGVWFGLAVVALIVAGALLYRGGTRNVGVESGSRPAASDGVFYVQPTASVGGRDAVVARGERQRSAANSSAVCSSDEECVLKSRPLCSCGRVESIEGCYRFDAEFPVVEARQCDPADPCLSIAIPTGCRCEDQQCVGVY